MVVIHRDVYSPQKDVMAARHDNSKNYNNTDGYGIAADIGTTTVAISLFSLDIVETLLKITHRQNLELML